MLVDVISFKTKDIKTKAGQAMTLRVVQGVDQAGDVFKTILPKTHPDIGRGPHDCTAEVYVNYDAELSSRVILTPINKPQPAK